MKHLSTIALTLALCAASVAAMAQTATPAKPAKKATKPVAAAKAQIGRASCRERV